MAKMSDIIGQTISQLESRLGAPVGKPTAEQPEPAEPPAATQPPEAPEDIAGEQSDLPVWSHAGRLAAARAALNNKSDS